MSNCASRAALLDFLETGRAAAPFERHLSECGRCGDALAAAARVEETLFDLAEDRQTRKTSLTRQAGGWTLAVAAAASVLMFLGSVGAARPVASRAAPALHASMDSGPDASMDGGVPTP